MMKICVFILGFIICNPLHARDAEWLSLKMNELKKIEKIEDPMLRLDKLSELLEIVTAPVPKDEYEKNVYSVAQKAIVAIPGHATQVKDRLENIRARIKAGEQIESRSGFKSLN